MRMKTRNQRFSLFILTIALCTTGFLSSCSKSKSNGPTGPKPPTNPGGYDSSNQIQPAALTAYWGFNGNFNETKSNLVATASGTAPTSTTGIKGQAYQGSGSSYLIIPFGSSASKF